jgi:hypothetical protein
LVTLQSRVNQDKSAVYRFMISCLARSFRTLSFSFFLCLAIRHVMETDNTVKGNVKKSK